MTSRDKEIRDLLVKVEDMRWNESLTSDDMDLIVKLIKEEHKKDRQTGPAIGQTYWFARVNSTKSYTYDADDFDLDICKFRNVFPEERFAEAELRANGLIQGVNNMRRELNESKEFDKRKHYIAFGDSSGLDVWSVSSLVHAPGLAYPFGVFKSSVDCEMCVREFKNELEWFYKEYSTLMAELDDYDWADAPGWR